MFLVENKSMKNVFLIKNLFLLTWLTDINLKVCQLRLSRLDVTKNDGGRQGHSCNRETHLKFVRRFAKNTTECL